MFSDTTERGARWLVSGRVQGVGFRWHVLREAQRLGVTGDVRNLPDGRVEIRAKGMPRDLDLLLEAVRDGPALARIDEIVARDLDANLVFGSFGVRS